MVMSNVTLEEQEELREILNTRKVLSDQKNLHIMAMAEIDKESDLIRKRFIEILNIEKH